MRKIFVAISIVLGIVLTIFLAFLITRAEHFRKLVPFISPGEKMPNVSFIDEMNCPFDHRDYLSKPIFFFVFERPCSTCTRNIIVWKKIAEIVKQRAYVFGIIQDKTEMMKIAKRNGIPFSLISPVDFRVFKNTWRVHLDISQTYLVVKDRVIHVVLGNIDGNEMWNIMQELKKVEER